MKIAQIFFGTNYEPRGRKFVNTLEKEGYNVVRILKKENSERYSFFVLNSIKKLIKEKPEWVHAHRISGYAPAIIYKILNPRVKIIYDKHDVHKLDFIFDKLLFFSKYILVCSDAHLEYLKKRTRNVVRIPNYSLFTPLIKSKINYVRKKIGLKKEEIFVLFQGSIVREYGLDLALQAMKQISNKRIKLVIIGWLKDKEYWEEMKKHFSDNVVYLGSKPFEQMNDYVGSADIGLVLFKKSRLTLFGDPNKMYEFLNCKVPIISTNLDYMKKIFAKFKGGVIIKDAKGLKQELLRLSLGKERIKIKTSWNFDWGSIKQDYLNLLRN